MMYAYQAEAGHLKQLEKAHDISHALWIDLFHPTEDQITAVASLGVEVPSKEQMEEIEVSSRIYTRDGVEYLTVMVPGRMPDGSRVNGPVTFIVSKTRLVTVRHHIPKPFEGHAERAPTISLGCDTPDRIFVGLFDDIIAHVADLLETVGHQLDPVVRTVFQQQSPHGEAVLRDALKKVGDAGDVVGQVHLNLLSAERALIHFEQTQELKKEDKALAQIVKVQIRDIRALNEHGSSLAQRVSLATDATLGMINLNQATATQLLSVVAALFLPPTLITSFFGMNFADMDVLEAAWGYKISILVMFVSVIATFVVFKWRRWI